MSGLSRRRLLATAAAVAALPRLGLAAPRATSFPKSFLWGASTSAAQIEGASDLRGPSIWDSFAARPGAIADGSTPAVTCDHYHRWREDVALMHATGFNAYRFSIAWPRVLPEGTGRVDAAGLDFYDRLVDGLLAAGIRPLACLYHWDLPQALQDRGGWMSRAMAPWFADYATIAAHRLGDRVPDWFTLNEPSVSAIFGHGLGEHAPGLNGGRAATLAALHHQNLAQGLALRALRAERPRARLGTVLSLQPIVPALDSPEDAGAVVRWDAVWNRVALDGLLRGAVPDTLAAEMAPLIQPGDLETLRYPIDVLGLNYYSRLTIRHEPGRLFDCGWGAPKAERFTAMGWPVQPDGLLEVLSELKQLYGNPPVIITENGAAYDDKVEAGGVHDGDRIAYLRDHLRVCLRALEQGCNLQGYLAWSLLDNWEWAFGTTKRFGLVRVDFPTGGRTTKDSLHWLGAIARGKALL
jgi:beta-glucosidase